MFLSIIMPVFNGEKYIVESLNSILGQWNSSFNVEVIIINDGSTDNTLKLIETGYKKQIAEGLFKLISQDNAGVSVARNNGIKKAKGDYITFVDADDYILPSYFTEIFTKLKSNPVDILEFGCISFKTNADIDKAPPIYTHNTFGSLKTIDVITNIFSASIFYPPLRVIKSSLFENNLFPIGVKFCEDLMLLQKIYRESKTIYHIKKPLYAYRHNNEGATRNIKPEYISGMIGFYSEIADDKASYIKFLKVNVFFVIYKLHEITNKKIALPAAIQRDKLNLLISVLFERKVSFKKKLILLSPSSFYKLRKIIKGYNK